MVLKLHIMFEKCGSLSVGQYTDMKLFQYGCIFCLRSAGCSSYLQTISSARAYVWSNNGF